MALDQLSQLALADAQYNLDNAFELTLEFTTDLNERFQLAAQIRRRSQMTINRILGVPDEEE